MKYYIWAVIFCLAATAYPGEFHFSGQVRYRFEYKNNFNFNDAVDDQQGLNLFRVRLNLDYAFSSKVRAFVQLQDARVGGQVKGSRAPYQDQVDVRQGYLTVGSLDEGSFEFQAGRMEMAYGDERLLGGFNWSNLAQSFDGIRFKGKASSWRYDLFVVRKVLIDYDDFNEWNEDDTLSGVWATRGLQGDRKMDLYAFYRDTDTPLSFGPSGSATLKESTVGVRFLKAKKKEWFYLLQGAYQFGDFGPDSIRAFAIIGQGGYVFPVKGRPTVGVEYSWGSGDDNPNDGTRETFDNLFPTNHKFYGYMDRASLQNIRDAVVFFSFQPDEKIGVTLHFHHLSLDTSTDALYAASRKVLRQGDGTNSADVGDELDITVKAKMGKLGALLLGYGHFSAGDFLRETGGADNGDFFYLQWGYSFK